MTGPRSIAVAAMARRGVGEQTRGPILGLVGPRLLAYLGQCRVNTAKSQTESFGSAPNLFSINGGRSPTTQEGLEALALAPSGLEPWNGRDVKGGPRVA
jgi:general secretion pathway protein G